MSMTTSESVAIWSAFRTLTRLVLGQIGRAPLSLPEVNDIGYLDWEWKDGDNTKMSEKIAWFQIILKSGHQLRITIFLASESCLWVPIKVEWHHLNSNQQGSFHFEGAWDIMVCDTCNHEYSPLIPEVAEIQMTGRSRCRYCPV